MVLAAPDRDTAQWSADSLGRSEVEEIAEGYSYGANTIRDGVSLTPRRELRALALPSEIMRLANLEGYLKFPGPFPVAAIRLKYVARPAAAERFVPREGDGAPLNARPADAADARDAGGDAFPDGDDIGIPEPADPDAAGLADAPDPPEMPAEPASWQGEPALVPLLGENRRAEADGGSAGNGRKRKPRPSRSSKAETGDGSAAGRKGDAPDADAAAPAPRDGPPDAGSGPEDPPRAAQPEGERPSEWL